MNPESRSLILLTLLAACHVTPHAGGDPLPSWNDGPTKQAIVAFVHDVTTAGSPHFVPPAERIAVFDNDGTLWAEQPFYTQLAFAIERVHALAAEHPEWQEQEPFRSVLRGDQAGIADYGVVHAMLDVVAATHGGITIDEFAAQVRAWLADARHPTLDRRYTELVYAPMLELLAYLRAHGFETWIVSGGGLDFMRPWTEAAYGIPPQQVIGSEIALRYEERDGGGVVLQEPEIGRVNDKGDKVTGIVRSIGRRPIAAFGNSDGDFAMLDWTTAGAGRRLGVLVHHDDAAREFAYDREARVGRLARGLDEAEERGWIVVSMRDDWAVVFP